MPDYCHMCGRYGPTETHHIYNGPNRKKADRMGLTVQLCHWCHNEPPGGVHFDQSADLALKRETQLQVMEDYGWTTQDFIREFGKSYI